MDVAYVHSNGVLLEHSRLGWLNRCLTAVINHLKIILTYFDWFTEFNHSANDCWTMKSQATVLKPKHQEGSLYCSHKTKNSWWHAFASDLEASTWLILFWASPLALSAPSVCCTRIHTHTQTQSQHKSVSLFFFFFVLLHQANFLRKKHRLMSMSKMLYFLWVFFFSFALSYQGILIDKVKLLFSILIFSSSLTIAKSDARLCDA